MTTELELLAPAKNIEIGTAAIDCGADSIYIAGPHFGAREKAGNPMADIASLCQYAHRFGAKVFLTLNTILREDELDSAQQLIYEAHNAGCDAIIVQDLSLLKMDLPPIEIHASTQCDIRTPEKAALLEKLGFDRLILARELSLAQIKEIRKATSVPLEFFIHGALCVSYSGQCYLSEYMCGRSANRGVCAQACRNNYDLIDESGRVLAKNKPLLSLKDLNLTNYIEELIDAGISSFKIEGRLKNLSYVKNIVSHYNSELNRICKQNASYKRASLGGSKPSFEPSPDSTFNRGYTHYFIEKERQVAELNSGIAKYLGEYIGRIKNFTAKNNVCEFTYIQENKGCTHINNGDGLSFVLPDKKVAGERANSCTNNRVRLSPTCKIRELAPGTKIYRNFNAQLESAIKRKTDRFIEVQLSVTAKKNGLKISCHWGDFDFDISGEVAENQEFCRRQIINQLSKKSDVFAFDVVECYGSFCFYKVADINAIRRELATSIAKIISDSYKAAERAIAEKRVSQKKFIDKELAKNALKEYIKDGKASYLANCANHLSAEVYKEIGIEAERYSPSELYGDRLMTTKYCIRKSLGICLKENNNHTGNLFLVNNNRRLALLFDCTNCNMIVKKT